MKKSEQVLGINQESKNRFKRKFLKKIIPLVLAGLILQPAGTFIFNVAAGYFETQKIKNELDNPEISLAEKNQVSEYLKDKKFQGPFQVSRLNDRVVIRDQEGKEVDKIVGVNMFSLMNIFDYYVQPGNPPVKKENLDKFLAELKEAGISYVRFLMTPEDFAGNKASEETYEKFSFLMKKLADHGMGACVVLNYWQYQSDKKEKIVDSLFANQDFISKQRNHIEKILEFSSGLSSLWEIHFANELVVAEGGNIGKMMGINTHLNDFYKLMDVLRQEINRKSPGLPFSTGFLSLMSAGLTIGPFSQSWTKFLDTNPDALYSHLDEIPFVTSFGSQNNPVLMVQQSEILRIKEDNRLPFQIAETGVYQHKKNRSQEELKAIAKYLAINVVRYSPQSISFWQVIDDETPKSAYDTMTLTISEFKNVLEFLR